MTRVLYGHSVNSNLMEMTKLNLFRYNWSTKLNKSKVWNQIELNQKIGYQISNYIYIYIKNQNINLLEIQIN